MIKGGLGGTLSGSGGLLQPAASDDGMATTEPILAEGEAALQNALVAEVRRVLDESGNRYLLFERFGLDIAIFVERDDATHARLIEAKVFAGHRPGGVGFGTPSGRGPQVELLLHSSEQLRLVDSSIRWVLGNALLPEAAPRYAFFNSVRAQRAAMGGVRRGKQNNLRINDFADELLTWERLTGLLKGFLLDQNSHTNDTSVGALRTR